MLKNNEPRCIINVSQPPQRKTKLLMKIDTSLFQVANQTTKTNQTGEVVRWGTRVIPPTQKQIPKKRSKLALCLSHSQEMLQDGKVETDPFRAKSGLSQFVFEIIN